MTDLQIIKVLEKEIGQKLPTIMLKDVGGSRSGYFLNSKSNVSGLNLCRLNLTDIPSSVFLLTSLVQLNISNNKIESIGSEFDSFKKLKTLGLYSNNISAFPYDILKLKQLRRLYIQNNKIESISKEDLELCKLVALDLSRNPLNIPPEFLKRGSPIKIITYLNSIGENSRPFNEVKVILVGDGAAGKTSLVNRLINDRYNSREPQTHGIKINSWINVPKQSNGDVIKFNFWDFGGQEIMHATHQFFMSKRSIYILVLNAREEPNPEYWLKSIESYGGNSPILVVINKIDENPSFDVNRKFLLEKYPSILGFHNVSCSTKEGIEDFAKELSESITKVPHLRNVWANNWFDLKNSLENISAPYISVDDYILKCKKQGINDSTDQQIILEFLNDLGIILHFKDYSLNDTHVLDPLWVTGGVYRIINSKILSECGGIIGYSDLEQILKKKEGDKFNYPKSKFKYLIELMKKFQLCYELENEKILIPDLLPVQEPEFEIEKGDHTKVIVEYDFLPKSILPRLIVNLHKDIVDNKRWRTGVILHDSKFNSTAIVKADYESKNITIQSLGTNQRDYLSVILHFLRSINSQFEKLTALEKVPLPDNSNLSVSINHLYRLEEMGSTNYFPDGANREYNVKELLGSVVNNNSAEKELFNLLEKVANKLDSTETLLEKANSIVQIQPNFFGLGLNLNALVDKFVRKKEASAINGYK